MKVFLKKLCLLALSFIIISAISCSSETSNMGSHVFSPVTDTEVGNYGAYLSMQSESTFLTFEDAIALSDCAAVAKYISYQDYGFYGEYEFKISEALYGDIPEKTIYLYSVKGETHVDTIDYSYNTGEDIYTKNEEYILIMSRDDLIFYDHPRYQLVTDIFMPLNDIDKSTMYGELIGEIVESGKNTDEKTLIKNIQKQNNSKYKDKKEENSKYSKSDKLTDIVTKADLILEVKIVDSLGDATFHNGSNYVCTVSQVLKGEKIAKSEYGTIHIVVFKNSVKIGESYVIMLDQTEGSTIYTQFAKKGIIPIKDSKTINEVEQISSQQNS